MHAEQHDLRLPKSCPCHHYRRNENWPTTLDHNCHICPQPTQAMHSPHYRAAPTLRPILPHGNSSQLPRNADVSMSTNRLTSRAGMCKAICRWPRLENAIVMMPSSNVACISSAKVDRPDPAAELGADMSADPACASGAGADPAAEIGADPALCAPKLQEIDPVGGGPAEFHARAGVVVDPSCCDCSHCRRPRPCSALRSSRRSAISMLSPAPGGGPADPDPTAEVAIAAGVPCGGSACKQALSSAKSRLVTGSGSLAPPADPAADTSACATEAADHAGSADPAAEAAESRAQGAPVSWCGPTSLAAIMADLASDPAAETAGCAAEAADHTSSTDHGSQLASDLAATDPAAGAADCAADPAAETAGCAADAAHHPAEAADPAAEAPDGSHHATRLACAGLCTCFSSKYFEQAKHHQ